MPMKLQTALKKVSLLKGEIKELNVRLQHSNNWTERQHPKDAAKTVNEGLPALKAKEILALLKAKKAELCKLKGKIAMANGVKQTLVATIGEHKDSIVQLTALHGDDMETFETKTVHNVDKFERVEVMITHKVSIGSKERQELIDGFKAEIQKLEEELNEHNYTTTISD